MLGEVARQYAALVAATEWADDIGAARQVNHEHNEPATDTFPASAPASIARAVAARRTMIMSPALTFDGPTVTACLLRKRRTTLQVAAENTKPLASHEPSLVIALAAFVLAMPRLDRCRPEPEANRGWPRIE